MRPEARGGAGGTAVLVPQGEGWGRLGLCGPGALRRARVGAAAVAPGGPDMPLLPAF